MYIEGTEPDQGPQLVEVVHMRVVVAHARQRVVRAGAGLGPPALLGEPQLVVEENRVLRNVVEVEVEEVAAHLRHCETVRQALLVLDHC
jgi:hypothetical protein